VSADPNMTWTASRVRRVCIAILSCVIPSSAFAFVKDDEAHSIADMNICAPLALSAAADLVGKPGLFDEIFRLLPPGKGPGTLEDLRVVSQEVGLYTSALRWERNSRVELSSPAIIHLEGPRGSPIGHFVLLVGAESSRYLVLDPIKPPAWVSAEDIWKMWDGVALHVSADPVGLSDYESTGWRSLRASIGTFAAAIAVTCLLVTKWKGSRNGIGSGLERSLVVLTVSVSCAGGAVAGLAWLLVRQSSVSNEMPIVAAPPSMEVKLARIKVGDDTVCPFDFAIRNNTNRVCKIERVDASCGCAKPVVSGGQIAPGGETAIHVDATPGAGPVTTFKITVWFLSPHDEKVTFVGRILLE
jgi:hypothetical protein